MLDAGYWIPDAGYWMVDAGCWILDAGYWILDAGYLLIIACMKFQQAASISVVSALVTFYPLIRTFKLIH